MEWRKAGQALKAFVIKQWLPLCFLVAILIAMTWPAPGKAVLNVVILGDVHLVQTINICIVFFISGLVLRTDAIKRALSHWLAIVYGVTCILGLTCCLGFALRELPLTPPEFATGLTIFAAVPTTLGVGEALVRSAKGNDTLALLLLVSTNLLGIATMPPWLKALLSSVNVDGLEVQVDALELFLKLLATVLAPALIGKAARDLIPPVGRFATKWKQQLGMFSTLMLACIIWQTLSGSQSVLVSQQFLDIFIIICAAILLHATYLVANWLITTYVLRLPLKERIAVTIMASQKSAPVAVTVISYISANVTQQGLLAVPCIIGQLAQIFMGAAFAPYLARMVKRQEQAEAAAQVQLEVTKAAAAEEGAAGSGSPASGGGSGGDEQSDTFKPAGSSKEELESSAAASEAGRMAAAAAAAAEKSSDTTISSGTTGAATVAAQAEVGGSKNT